MANYGTTEIAVTGFVDELATLRSELSATACDGQAFTLIAAAPDAWTRDEPLVNSAIGGDSTRLLISGDLAHDRDFLPLVDSLSRRYPNLKFYSLARFESSWPDVVVSHHAGGQLKVSQRFSFEFSAWFSRKGGGQTHLAFYPRSAVLDGASNLLGQDISDFQDCEKIVGDWMVGHDQDNQTVFLHLQGECAEALILDRPSKSVSWLKNVNRHGGYALSETLTLDEAVALHPELLVELTREGSRDSLDAVGSVADFQATDGHAPF